MVITSAQCLNALNVTDAACVAITLARCYKKRKEIAFAAKNGTNKDKNTHTQRIQVTGTNLTGNCIIIIIHKEKSNKTQQCIKFYYSIFIRSSTCFGRQTAHHQEPKIVLVAPGFSYVVGCWTCSWWTLSGMCLTTSSVVLGS